MQRQKILLDTDIGDDIDDALALALLLRSDKLDLVGVTTVFGDTAARARIAGRILDLTGRRDIPVYAGSGEPLNQKREPWKLCQMTGEADRDRYDAVNAAAAKKDGGESAVDFIIETAARYGKDLTIVGIGPFTNLAKAIRKAPDVLGGVGKITVMGGTFLEQHREWNVLCDVDAAEILFDFCENLYCVGYDVTQKTTVSWAEHRRMMTRTGDKLRDYLAKLVTMWSDTCWHAPVLHDPLVICGLENPEVLQFRLADVVVETEGKYTRGMTVNRDCRFEGNAKYLGKGKTHIAVAVDACAVRRAVMNTLFPGGSDRFGE